MGAATIDPFRQEGHCCQKCWNEDVRFTFHEGNTWATRHGCAAVALLNTSRPGEHICLSCTRCGHQWAMRTAQQNDAHAHEANGYGCCRTCGKRVECGRCRNPYDEDRDAWGVCAECLVEAFDDATPEATR